MCRRFTLREAGNQLGLIDDLSDDDDNGEDAEFIPVEDGEDDEEVVEDDGEVAVDDEGDIEAFEERDDNDTDDDEVSSDEAANSDHSDGEGRAFDCIPSKSGISYTTQEIPNRRRRRNILTQRPRAIATPQTDIESFEHMLTEEIIRTVLRNTNRKVRELRRTLSTPQNYHNFSMEEFKAALALILRAGSDRDNFTELKNLWEVGDSKPFYRAVMSLNRFKCFLRCIRFDNWHTREQRKVNDKFAAISEIWGIFLGNIRRVYVPDECITMDEQLVGYRGRIPGRTYMPSKPRKYGLKIFWACESSTGYALNAIAYGGKEGDQVHRNLGQDIVLRLLEPYYGTGRDVCTDNFVTSYNLAKLLLEKSLTILGTIRTHRREIPSILNNRMELYSSKFLYNHDDGVCLVAYQAKKNKKPVMLLSSTHTDSLVTAEESKKPLVILDYNQRKGGVDRFDENLEEFSCRRKTVRWPLLFFYNMVDAAANNSYILMKKSGRYSKSKKEFLKNLTFQLAKPAVEARLRLSNQKHTVRDAASQVGFSLPFESSIRPGPTSSRQTRCRICKKHTRSRCDNCGKGVCPQHRKIVKSCKCGFCA